MPQKIKKAVDLVEKAVKEIKKKKGTDIRFQVRYTSKVSGVHIGYKIGKKSFKKTFLLPSDPTKEVTDAMIKVVHMHTEPKR